MIFIGNSNAKTDRCWFLILLSKYIPVVCKAYTCIKKQDFSNFKKSCCVHGILKKIRVYQNI